MYNCISKEEKLELEFFEYFDSLYFNDLIRNNVLIREAGGAGWTVNGEIQIEPLYLNLIGRFNKLILGTQNASTFFEDFIPLYDREFELFLGWEKPKTSIELLKHFESLMRQESVLENHIYYLIMKDSEVIGVLYFYDFKIKYRKAKLTIGLKKEYRGKKLASLITKSVIKKFMSQGVDRSLLVRLGIEIETTNINSISSVERNLPEFQMEGAFRNNYGVGIDCFVYSYVLLPPTFPIGRALKPSSAG